MKFAAYQNYKPSGVEWLGEIPSHWEIWKIAHGFQMTGSGTTPPSDNQDWYDGNICWVTTSELRERIISDTEKKVSQEALDSFSALKVFPKGSLAIAMYGATIGRLGIFGIEAATNQACCVLYGHKTFDTKFVFYWLQVFREQIILLATGGGQPNISQEKVRSIRIACPLVEEQQAIVRYLDTQTARIDTLLAKKRQLIDKLKEKRSALIARTVTRGLPPDAAKAAGLEPHPAMKDSGVEWLGMVPAHWRLRRLKDFGQLVAGSAFPHEYQGIEDAELPFYKVGDLVFASDGKFMGACQNTISQQIASDLRARLVPSGAVIYAKIGAALLLNRRRITTQSCCLDNNMTAYIPDRQCASTQWAYYWLSILDFGEFTNPGAIPSLSEGYQATLPLAVPPHEEQQAIAAYLDRKTTRIDQLTSKVEAAIACLTEYRQALITSAVTGKIDVRETMT